MEQVPLVIELYESVGTQDQKNGCRYIACYVVVDDIYARQRICDAVKQDAEPYAAGIFSDACQCKT